MLLKKRQDGTLNLCSPDWASLRLSLSLMGIFRSPLSLMSGFRTVEG